MLLADKIPAVHCEACGAAAPHGSRFCPACGRPFAGVPLRLDGPELDALTRPAAGAAADDLTRLPLDAVTRPVIDDATRAPTAPAASTDLSFEPGERLAGRYRIVRLLGRGGMGAVFLADDLRLNQPVAIKFLPPALAADPARLAAFHNEVSIARQISHPNVCRVYDIGDVDGHLFLTMEYVDGEDLASALRHRGAFPEAEGIELARQICAGLAAVHARGVLHRDLKPANIMLNKAGQAQLMDFGIAAPGGTTSIEGTPANMAPEQLAGRAASVHSDIYALGLVMREILTARRDAPGPVRVNARVQEAISRSLDPDPAKRPQSAAAVTAMLQVVLLDARTMWLRVLHILLQLTAVPLWVVGFQLMRLRGDVTTGLALLAVGLVLGAVPLWFPIGWTVSYKGHRIRFFNHPVWGERLYIDDRLADRGRVGFSVTMRGTIESGAGAGERISCHSRCTFLVVECRIVAESFG